MKDIKQYIGKKVAIECASSEEWDQISKLTGNTSINYFNSSRGLKLFALDDLGTYWGYIDLEDPDLEGYTIYPASDFIEFQFEVGKWYTTNEWTKNSYAKFESQNNGQFYYSEKIYDGKHIIQTCHWGIYGNFREVPIEEIQHLLPKKTEINTYGLKVGDYLPEQKIRDWSNIGKNRFDDNFKDPKIWEQVQSTFAGDREILSFKLLDGVVGFKVSSTLNVYLRAEGFKEFLEDSFVLPEKWQIRITKENLKFINSIRDRMINIDSIMTSDLINPNIPTSWRSSFSASYTEITLDQFKKYVLKESSLPSSQSDFREYRDGGCVIIDEHKSIDKELVIPKIHKVLSAVDYSVQTKLPELNISLPKNKAKEVKQIKIENFLITI